MVSMGVWARSAHRPYSGIQAKWDFIQLRDRGLATQALAPNVSTWKGHMSISLTFHQPQQVSWSTYLRNTWWLALWVPQSEVLPPLACPLLYHPTTPLVGYRFFVLSSPPPRPWGALDLTTQSTRFYSVTGVPCALSGHQPWAGIAEGPGKVSLSLSLG